MYTMVHTSHTSGSSMPTMVHYPYLREQYAHHGTPGYIPRDTTRSMMTVTYPGDTTRLMMPSHTQGIHRASLCQSLPYPGDTTRLVMPISHTSQGYNAPRYASLSGW